MAHINEQHFQLPRRKNEDIISPREQLIYLAIKYFDNPTKDCYPSLDKISKLVKLSIPTIRKSIQLLKDAGYIEIEKIGKRQYYKFNDSKKFEVFSREFMENSNISPTTKSYLASIQEFMDRNNLQTGNVSWSNRELSEMINMPESTISSCNRELVKLNYLTLTQSKVRDKVTGCPKQIKFFNLREFGQAVAFKFLEVDDKIKECNDAISKTNLIVEQNTENIKEIKEKLDEVLGIVTDQKSVIDKQVQEMKAKDKTIEILQRELQETKKQQKVLTL